MRYFDFGTSRKSTKTLRDIKSHIIMGFSQRNIALLMLRPFNSRKLSITFRLQSIHNHLNKMCFVKLEAKFVL